MKNTPIHVMPIALIAPEEELLRGEPSGWLGRWMGRQLTGLQMLAARRDRAPKFNPRRFDEFHIWSMPVEIRGRRRRAA